MLFVGANEDIEKNANGMKCRLKPFFLAVIGDDAVYLKKYEVLSKERVFFLLVLLVFFLKMRFKKENGDLNIISVWNV